MRETAKQLVALSAQRAQAQAGGPGEAAAESSKRGMMEIKARVQGCFDVGETLRVDREPTQALDYYDAVCEFSSLPGDVGTAVPGFEPLTQRGCAAGQAAREGLERQETFTPQLFADLFDEADAEAESAEEGEVGMVFSLDEQ